MSIEETRRVLEEYLEALLNGGDFARFFAEDVLWTTMETGEQFRGRESVAKYITALHNTLFDAAPEIRTRVAVDGVAFIEADFVGTHIGEVAGIPPTGVSVRLPYCVVYDIAGPSITSVRGYFPIAVMVQRLTEAAAAAAATD